MKKSILLQLAKERLEQRKTKHVCIAIRETGDHVRFDGIRRANELRDWIHSDLLNGQYSTYEEWLEDNHPDLAKLEKILPKIEIGMHISPLEIINARLSWMDWMIQYWQAKGD